MGVSKDVVVVSDFGSNVCWFLRSRILAMVSSFFILLLFFHLLNLTITDTSPGTDHFELGPPFLLSSSCSSLDFSTTSEKENWATLDVLGPPAVKLLKNLSSSSSASAADTNQSTDDGRVVEDSFKDLNLNSCSLYEGRWVVDEDGPYYLPGSCPLIDASFDCARNGRPDSDYTKLRWQPNGCNIPRLDGKRMLEMMRGKRLAFVGDSLNRNMWESLVCILRESLEDKSRAFEVSGRHEFKTEGFYAFRFLDYNCSVEFVRSPFLVQEWEVLNSTAGGRRETLRLDVIERSSSQYREADFLIFNTGHWWTHPKTSQGKEYYQEGNHIYPELHVGEAYRKALQTWARWVDRNIDSNRTQIVFRGYSPSHFRGGQWNSGGSCDGEEQPITNDSYLSHYPKMMKIFESVMGRMRTPVSYLNITRMSDYRKDGHPSIFREPPAERQQQLGGRVQDCSHWCLPGIPDVWNQLLYAVLLRNQRH